VIEITDSLQTDRRSHRQVSSTVYLTKAIKIVGNRKIGFNTKSNFSSPTCQRPVVMEVVSFHYSHSYNLPVTLKLIKTGPALQR
jgi:hypothetical protein